MKSLLFTLLSVCVCFADDVTVSWDANSEYDLSGYRICYGTTSGDYQNVIDVRNVTEHIITGLGQEAIYFFVVTAYDMAGNESGFSKEVVYIPTDFNGYTKIVLYNILGQRVGEFDRVDMYNLASGVYIKVYWYGSMLIKTERIGFIR